MKILWIILIIVLTFHSGISGENWQWRDPLQFQQFDFADKYLLIYNLAALSLSLILSERPQADSLKFRVSYYSEYAHEFNRRLPLSDIYSGKIRISYPLRKWVNSGYEFHIHKINDALVDAIALGGALSFEWRLLKTFFWQLNFDNGVGIIYANQNFPNEGTHFNFNTFYGLTAYINFRKSTRIMFGFRSGHISNAYLFGDSRNPAFDSVGFLMGFEFATVR